MRGYVYALTNPAMHGLVKIGSTAVDPYQRASALSSSTGVPVPFQVALYGEFLDCRLVERRVHDSMARMRVNPWREFFQCGKDWLALREAASWICHHPQQVGELRVSTSVLRLCRLDSLDDLLNPWKATL